MIIIPAAVARNKPEYEAIFLVVYNCRRGQRHCRICRFSFLAARFSLSAVAIGPVIILASIVFLPSVFCLKIDNAENFVICHNIRSRHNVGSIFRTADGAGVSKIFMRNHARAASSQHRKSFLGRGKIY